MRPRIGTGQKPDKAPDLPFPWWRRRGSNPRPSACKADALPTELRPRAPESIARCLRTYPDLRKRDRRPPVAEVPRTLRAGSALAPFPATRQPRGVPPCSSDPSSPVRVSIPPTRRTSRPPSTLASPRTWRPPRSPPVDSGDPMPGSGSSKVSGARVSAMPAARSTPPRTTTSATTPSRSRSTSTRKWSAATTFSRRSGCRTTPPDPRTPASTRQ
jgi:hypothetical protein